MSQYKIVEPLKEIRPNILSETKWDIAKSKLILTLTNQKAVPVEARVRRRTDSSENAAHSVELGSSPLRLALRSIGRV